VETPYVCPFGPSVPPSAHLSLPPPPTLCHVCGGIVRQQRAATPGPERPAATPDPERLVATPDPERRAATPDPERRAARWQWPVTAYASGGGGGGQARRWRAAQACARGCGYVSPGVVRERVQLRVRVWAWACECGCGTSVKPAAAHVVRAERGGRGPSCTTATRGGSLRFGWAAWSPGLPVEATGLWWGVRVQRRPAVPVRRYETARRSGRQGRLRYGAGVRAWRGAEVQRSRRQGRLLGRLGRPPTWSRHSCGDGFLMMGAKPGGI
jgi:hypothetical protein